MEQIVIGYSRRRILENLPLLSPEGFTGALRRPSRRSLREVPVKLPECIQRGQFIRCPDVRSLSPTTFSSKNAFIYESGCYRVDAYG
jgi:hypothetical protein